jgi:2-polyprenyl-3-methyl-5-hydroxy-6-metoxy-1,4-benzoquinol methylase
MDPLASRAPYLLDNAGAEAPVRLAALAAMFDPGTIRHLESRGVGPGWHCLEVGGGGGSIAAWLARRVGATGHVLVTDIDPRFLHPLDLPNVEVRRHDIATDALHESAFDVIHVRLVLNHLAEPARVLARLRTALKPGGWLVCEEFDSESMPPDPTLGTGELRLRTQNALGRLMADRGFDRRFGRRLFAHLRAQGLADVGAEGRLFMVQGGSPGADLVRANCEQLRIAMIDAGDVTAREIDDDLARLDDSEFMMPSSIMWAAWGRRIARE